MEKEQNKIVVFQEKGIRRVWHNEEWYFSIVDVVEVLTASPIPRTYWSKLKAKILAESELNPNWVQLKMMSADGKFYKTDATNKALMKTRQLRSKVVVRLAMPSLHLKNVPVVRWLPAGILKDRLLPPKNRDSLSRRKTRKIRIF